MIEDSNKEPEHCYNLEELLKSGARSLSKRNDLARILEFLRESLTARFHDLDPGLQDQNFARNLPNFSLKECLFYLKSGFQPCEKMKLKKKHYKKNRYAEICYNQACLCKNDSAKKVIMKKYGVDNVSRLPDIVNKRKETFKRKFGKDNPMKCESIQKKARETMISKWGKDNPSKVDEIKNKRRETFIKNFGTDNPMKNPEIKRKLRETFLKTYNASNPMKTVEIKEKLVQVFLEVYGEKNPALVESVKNKIKQTNLARFGFTSPLSNKNIQNKLKEYFLAVFGVDNPMKCERVKEKLKQKNLQKYGVENPAKLESVKNKIRKANREKYGVDCFFQRHLSQDTINKMNDPEWLRYQHHVLKKSGVEIGKEIGVSETLICKKLNKFGIKVISHSRSLQEKEIERFLVDSLGENQIETNKKNIISPYELDIYIPEKNLAIEYCGLFWHSEKSGEKGMDYHSRKQEKCQEKNIRLITIFSNEWNEDPAGVKEKLTLILQGEEWKLFENNLGDETIMVDRRWSDGKILEKFGYVLHERLPPKKWYICKRYERILVEEPEDKDSHDWIWDCGYLCYRKKG